MRRRITRTLLAAAAAGVTAGTLGLTAAGAANAAVSRAASGNIGPTMATTSTSQVIATSNGLLPPSGTTRVSPTPLWSDGLSGNNEVRLWDAFGVWAR